MKILYYLLITINAAIIIHAIFRYKELDKKHLDEISDLLDEIDAKKHTIEEHEKTIVSKKNKLAEENEEIINLNNEVKDLKEELSSTIREKNKIIDSLNIQLETKDKLLIKESLKLKEKESKRIASAGTINSKQKKIDNLEKKINDLKELHKQELEKKDITIEFYKSKLPEPTLKELKDYKYKRKKSSDKYV